MPRMITPEAREWIGRVYPPKFYDVSTTDIAKFSHAVGETSPVHFDPGRAQEAGFRDVVAPLSYYIAVRTAAYMNRPSDELLADGVSGEDFPPIRATQSMAGETRVRFINRIYAGDRIRIDKTLIDLYEKRGSSGPLAFMKFTFRLSNQTGAEAVIEDYTRVLR